MPSHYPLTVQFNRHSEADVPIFEQPFSDEALKSIIQNLQIATYKYPQQKGTASERSDTDIWRHIDNQIWGKTGNPMAIKPMLEKRIANNAGKNILQDQSIINNKAQIEEINKRLSEQITQVGKDVTTVGGELEKVGSGNFLSGILGGTGIGALVALGAVAFIMLRK
jgi:hypothetical protein